MEVHDSTIFKALDQAYKTAHRIQLDGKDSRWIFFSDHHRGRKDGADDFAVCEANYLKALDHYFEEDYTLCLLGDVEEFWENSPLMVMANYMEVLKSERRFYKAQRLHRIWGNHDDDWRIAEPVSDHLGELFPKIKVNESIVLELANGGLKREMLLIHGHQGTLDSDRWAWLSRLFVRFIWRNIQRLFKVPLSTPSTNMRLKSNHDKAMYEWAEHHDRVVICGHTHHPVFMSYTHADRIKHELNGLIAVHKESPSADTEQAISDLQEQIRKVENEEGISKIKAKPKPFYFNTGCCSFSDGDITGIEIAEGEIRLIKWSNKDGQRKVLGSTKLEFLLNYNNTDS